MANRNVNRLKAPPSAREVLGRVLATLKKMGSPEQKAEAQEIEDVLHRHFYGQAAEAVNFAREEEPAGVEGLKS